MKAEFYFKETNIIKQIFYNESKTFGRNYYNVSFQIVQNMSRLKKNNQIKLPPIV